MNADSFGYLPAKLNEPRPPEEASWSLVFESEKTMGRSSTGDNYIYLWEALAYLKNSGQLEVADILNPSPDEARATADFLIERKQVGQFRNFWKILGRPGRRHEERRGRCHPLLGAGGARGQQGRRRLGLRQRQGVLHQVAPRGLHPLPRSRTAAISKRSTPPSNGS